MRNKFDLDDFIHQKDLLSFIINEHGEIEKDPWFIAYEYVKSNIQDLSLSCALIPNTGIKNILKKAEWDFWADDGYPGLIANYNNGNKENEVYYRYGNCRGFEPLIIRRDFHGIQDSYFEISEEFRLFHNLYYDKKNNKYTKIYDDGNEEDVIIIDERQDKSVSIKIKLKQIKEYITIKRMTLVSYFDIFRFTNLTVEPIYEEVGGNNYRYTFFISELDFPTTKKLKIMSRMFGKKTIKGLNKKIDYYGENTKKSYEKFIIGLDNKGNEKYSTCNPEKLANLFGKNKGAPLFLTPVFFKREVLEKYYTSPSRYTVEDGLIRCKGLWSLRIDNSNKKYVTVFLGDLGDLSDNEQKYWKSYNVKPDGGISKTFYKRMIEGDFADPEMEDLVFKQEFDIFNEKWENKFGWPLFKELQDNDKHYFDTLRIPLRNDQSEFDQQVLSLAKILIDSLNESKFEKYIQKEDNDRGLDKFKKFLIENSVNNYEPQIEFLKDLYALRSSGVGHRKSSNYIKISKKFKMDKNDFIEVFREILGKSIDVIRFLDKSLLS